MKNEHLVKRKSKIFTVTMATFLLAISTLIPSAFSHGGKNHGENGITAYSVLKEATVLYGQLLEKGKLAETWELDLDSIKVTTRQKQGNTEFVVSFEKSSGDPNKVFIFFDATGKYSGSNFTGK